MARAKSETAETAPVEMSAAKQKFAALIESYEKQNPAKYALKKEALMKQLEAME